MEESSHAASSSECETSLGENGNTKTNTEKVNSTESLANGNTESLSNGEAHTAMDAVLEEESERLDKVMLKSKEGQKENNAAQVSHILSHEYDSCLKLFIPMSHLVFPTGS